jgi:hypothetical protein
MNVVFFSPYLPSSGDSVQKIGKYLNEPSSQQYIYTPKCLGVRCLICLVYITESVGS